MKRFRRHIFTGLLVLTFPLLASAKTILVTTSSTNSIAGQTNLTEAILALENGDSIQFGIPGAIGQVHYLECPPGGFPLIIKDNVIVDGYSQSGAVPNSNPLTASNNARIKIVLDGRNGNARDMSYATFDGTAAKSLPPINNTSMAADRPGYFLDLAILGIYRATNVTIKGLAFLGMREDDFLRHGISVAHDYGLDTNVLDRTAYNEGSSRNCHIQGCWFGVDPANATLQGLAGGHVAITSYRHRGPNAGLRPELPGEGLVIGVKPGTANPKSQFNVVAGWLRAVGGECIRWRISGNFVGILPDGVTPADMSFLANPGDWITDAGGSLIENRGYNATVPIYIGTDGDGVNDADEGNVFGPLGNPNIGRSIMLDLYSGLDETYVVAGNTFGIGVNGMRWTNATVIVQGIRPQLGTKLRFGSDFDGVSDSVEANRVFNNWPFAFQYPPPRTSALPFFDGLTNPSSTNGWISLRGNLLVNNAPPPLNPAAPEFAGFYNTYVETNAALPVLSSNSTTSRLSGQGGAPQNGFSYLIVDVYLPDPEGQTNGASFGIPELGGTNGWGFVQGRTYLGSYVDNSAADLNSVVGQFNFDITSLGLAAGTRVTAAITYSQDPPGTPNGRGMTTAFAVPVQLKALPLMITGVSRANNNVTLNWSGGVGPFSIERKNSLADQPWSPVASGLAGPSHTFSDSASTSFYHITGN